MRTLSSGRSVLVKTRSGLVLGVRAAGDVLVARLEPRVEVNPFCERAAIVHGYWCEDDDLPGGERVSTKRHAGAPTADIAAWFAALQHVALCPCAEFFITDGPAPTCISCELLGGGEMRGVRAVHSHVSSDDCAPLLPASAAAARQRRVA